MGPYFLSVGADLPTVALAVGIAMLGLFAALDLGAQAWTADDRVAKRLWMAATSIALGTAVWSTDVVGMAAAGFPQPAAYDILRIALAWGLAVAMAAVPVSIAPRVVVTRRRMATLAVLTSAGLTSVHYAVIFALTSGPMPQVRAGHLLAIALLCVAACFAGLALFLRFRQTVGWRRLRLQALAAAVTGCCLAAVHFLAMASVPFVASPHALPPRGLEVEVFGHVIAVTSVVFMSITIMMTVLERKAAERARLLHGSLHRVEEELRLASLSDPLTGLPNRLVFQDRLTQAVARSQPLAVLLVDLDGFKDHASVWTPDREAEVLRAMAGRLKAVCRDADILTTAGNGRFLVLIEDPDAATLAARTAQAALEAIRRPCFGSHGLQARLTASIGISLRPGNLAPAGLVANASAAMLAAARQGGDRFRFHEDRMNGEAQAAAELLDDLRHAVARGELRLHFQPKVFAPSGLSAGVEALVRWQRPGHGIVGPATFIPLAERFGLIDEIGHWVFDEACRQVRLWSDAGLALRTAVNISAAQLRQPALAAELMRCVRQHGVDPRLLTLEITETAAMEDTSHSLRTLDALTAEGINISVDDFGTGYSSLSYLRRLPVRQIKIDRSFVCDLEASADARAIAEAIINMAHSLRLEVVAEGVETASQRGILTGMGCDKLQGWLFARPMPAEGITELLAGRFPAKLLAEAGP